MAAQYEIARLMFSISVGIPPYLENMPSASGPSAPPPHPTAFITTAALARARGSIASYSDAKMFES